MLPNSAQLCMIVAFRPASVAISCAYRDVVYCCGFSVAMLYGNGSRGHLIALVVSGTLTTHSAYCLA